MRGGKPQTAMGREKSLYFLQLFLAVSAFPVSAKAYANICPASGKIAKQRNGAHPAWPNKWIFDSSVKSRSRDPSIGVRKTQLWAGKVSESGVREEYSLRSCDPCRASLVNQKWGVLWPNTIDGDVPPTRCSVM